MAGFFSEGQGSSETILLFLVLPSLLGTFGDIVKQKKKKVTSAIEKQCFLEKE